MFEPGSDDDLIVRTVREFVERDVLPVAAEMERHDTYPEALVATMGRLGLFGLNVPEDYGGVDAGYAVFAARPARSCSTTSSFPRRTSSAGSRDTGSRS